MIDRLKQMGVFARVVDKGSFRGAAKDIGLAPSRISEIVSELEAFLGVTLLYRTTRKISLTSEGRIFYERAAEMLRSAEAGLNALNALSAEPMGALRISMPAFFSASPISSAIGEFARKYPNVSFSVAYTDNRMRLVEDGFDLNIRVGWLEDSTLMSRKLAGGERHLVAGKEYVKNHPSPERPSDLEDWNWIHFRNRSDTATFTSPQGQTETVTGKSQIEVDSIEAVYHFATMNLGATILPSFLAERGVASGKLVRLLPQWTLSPVGIYAVWSDASRRESLTLTFVRYLADQDLC